MSVEFRQRKPGEYFQILWKRKWLIILPAIAIATAIAWVVWRLPNVYESTTLLIVKPPTIPNFIAPTLSDVDLSVRINNLGQIVTSRSSLEALIEKHNLYRKERLSGVTMASLVTHMQSNIKIEVDKSRNDITNAFRISFRERDPQTTQLVTAALADKYVTQSLEVQTIDAKQTLEFIEAQLAQAKSELDTIDQKRLEFMSANLQTLPGSAGSLLGQYTALREQQRTLIAEIGRLTDRRTASNGTLSILKQQVQNDSQDLAREMSDIRRSPQYGALITQKSTLQTEIDDMLATLKPNNPDVKKKQAQLDSIERQIKQLEEQGKKEAEEIRRLREGRPNLQISGIESDLTMIDGDLARLQKDLGAANAQVADIEGRINAVPGTEVTLEGINREYQTKKDNYDELLRKKNQAQMNQNITTDVKGETIQVVDPANLPFGPVAPRRMVLTGAGLFLGLILGVIFAAAFEMPRLLTIQTVEDAVHYTGLPVLVSVPELMTPQEALRRPRARLALLAAGVVLTLVSIPVLAYALKFLGVFDRFVS
jgi:succinoglycan biosynthesis transport protein ExoP